MATLFKQHNVGQHVPVFFLFVFLFFLPHWLSLSVDDKAEPSSVVVVLKIKWWGHNVCRTQFTEHTKTHSACIYTDEGNVTSCLQSTHRNGTVRASVPLLQNIQIEVEQSLQSSGQLFLYGNLHCLTLFQARLARKPFLSRRCVLFRPPLIAVFLACRISLSLSLCNY